MRRLRPHGRVPQVELIVMPGPAEVQCPAPWSRKINGRRARAIGQYPASDDVRAIQLPALGTQRLDVGAGCLGDPQAVQREQRDQRMLGHAAEPGRDEQGADLVAVQAGRMRLVVQPRPAHVHRRGCASSSSSTA